MKLKILDSGSKANGYVIQNEHEALIIEAGVHAREALKAVNFDIEKIKGCIVSHSHGDHSKYIKEYQKLGINICMSAGAASELPKENSIITIKHSVPFYLGGFKIIPFNVNHDCLEPLGFLIEHKDMGRLLFATDTSHLDYKFEGLTNIMIESNYSPRLLKKLALNGDLIRTRYDRIINNHMSIDTAIKTMKQFDLSQVRNIILLHLSDSNSNEMHMIDLVRSEFGINCVAANVGVEVDLRAFLIQEL